MDLGRELYKTQVIAQSVLDESNRRTSITNVLSRSKEFVPSSSHVAIIPAPSPHTSSTKVKSDVDMLAAMDTDSAKVSGPDAVMMQVKRICDLLMLVDREESGETVTPRHNMTYRPSPAVVLEMQRYVALSDSNYP